jgi:mono/diheme cytochrome c family protein
MTALALGLLLAAGQTAPAAPAPGTAAQGLAIYSQAGCAACHAASLDQESSDGLRRAGHPLEGAAYRGTWWNGRIATDVGDASEFCLLTFVDPNSEGFGADERKALVLFMQGLGSERGISPLVLLRRDAGDVDLSKGDAGRGKETYRRACGSCHGTREAEATTLVKDLSPAQIADVIRKGSGRMPFFQVDRLTAAEVADVSTWLDAIRKPVKP